MNDFSRDICNQVGMDYVNFDDPRNRNRLENLQLDTKNDLSINDCIEKNRDRLTNSLDLLRATWEILRDKLWGADSIKTAIKNMPWTPAQFSPEELVMLLGTVQSERDHIEKLPVSMRSKLNKYYADLGDLHFKIRELMEDSID